MSRPENGERRKLRFALFLQMFAAVMFIGAGLVRGFALGWDTFTWLFVGAGLIAAVFATFTLTLYRNS
jgi:hypothetical protein